VASALKLGSFPCSAHHTPADRAAAWADIPEQGAQLMSMCLGMLRTRIYDMRAEIGDADFKIKMEKFLHLFRTNKLDIGATVAKDPMETTKDPPSAPPTPGEAFSWDKVSGKRASASNILPVLQTESWKTVVVPFAKAIETGDITAADKFYNKPAERFLARFRTWALQSLQIRVQSHTAVREVVAVQAADHLSKGKIGDFHSCMRELFGPSIKISRLDPPSLESRSLTNTIKFMRSVDTG
jgi:hypothetical protein